MSFKPSKEFLKCYPYYKDFNKKSNTRKKSKKKAKLKTTNTILK